MSVVLFIFGVLSLVLGAVYAADALKQKIWGTLFDLLVACLFVANGVNCTFRSLLQWYTPSSPAATEETRYGV